MIDFEGKFPKLLVIGDLMIDHYLWGSCERVSPEAPVQIVNINKKSTVLGGAGNVINNLKALGAKVDVISVVGDCESSFELKKLLESIAVETKYLVTQKYRITSKKTRIISSHQQVVRYDQESTDEISNVSQEAVLEIFNRVICNYDIVLISDYGKGVLTSYLTSSLINIATRNNKKVLVDPKGLDYSKYQGAYLLTPNKKEASEITQIDITNKKDLEKAITQLKARFDLNISLITLSEEGVAIFDDDLRIHPTLAREVFDVTGAGDSILASLGFAIACDFKIDDAVKFANLAAGIVVGKIGSASASMSEIIDYESSLEAPSSEKHIKNWDEISNIVGKLKNKDKKIIFTNGCFDILHIGHIKFLEKSKKFGDVLIVGLNSDNSIKNLKGQNRPIYNQTDRAYILASLEVVDYLVIFDQDTPYDLIKLIKPDVLVKGGDYDGIEVVGQDIVKELKLVEFIDGKSTTKTIERIQKL